MYVFKLPELWKKRCHTTKKRNTYTGQKREEDITKRDIIYQKRNYMCSHAGFEVWKKMSKLNCTYQEEKYIQQKETCTFHEETNVDHKETNIYHRETYICSHARLEIRKKMSKETSTYPEERYIQHKETYIYYKETYIYHKETYIYHKETYIYHKETYIRSHCGLEVSQISPKKLLHINMSKETFIILKRDPQKETVKRDRKKSKETYEFQKEACKRDIRTIETHVP